MKKFQVEILGNMSRLAVKVSQHLAAFYTQDESGDYHSPVYVLSASGTVIWQCGPWEHRVGPLSESCRSYNFIRGFRMNLYDTN